MYAAIVLIAMAASGTAVASPLLGAQVGPPGPGSGAGLQPYGYGVWANKPGTSGHGRPDVGGGGGGAQPSKGCVLMPGPYPSMQACGGNGAPFGLTPVSGPGGGPAAPTITPEQLALSAYRHLALPDPRIRTAPPRGKDGLVGLRHFYWAERGVWRPLKKRAQAGPVWAEVTAAPTRLVISPGDRSSVACGGPGTPYDPSRSPDRQKTDCSHFYERSSAGLPGSAYLVTADVLWTAIWVGSGGAGGGLPSITRSTAFPVRIAEGQALIQRSS